MKKNILYFFYFLLSVNIFTLSNDNYAQSIENHFEKLSVIVPNCVIQDKFGFMWVGSQGGLLRYDGYKFKHFSHIPFDSNSISSDFVTVIKEDEKGNLWIGTNGGGLNYFDRMCNKFTTYNDTIDNLTSFGRAHITDIELNIDGSLWIGTEYQGLISLSIDSNSNPIFKNYHFHKNQRSTEENYILDLQNSKEGKLWIGTLGRGLIVFDPITSEPVHYLNDPNDNSSISSNTISSICEDDFGNMWMATGSNMSIDGNGLLRFTKKTKKFIRYGNDLNDTNTLISNQLSSILIDKNNTMWIGTVGKGITSASMNELLENEKPRFKVYKNLSSEIVNSLYEDKIGKIWIPTWDFFLRVYDPKQNKFSWYKKGRHKNSLSLSDSKVRSLYIDKSGKQWFGTDGLDVYDPFTSTYKHYYHSKNSKSISSNWITGMCEDQLGNFWFATNGGGLNRFNSSTEDFEIISPTSNKFEIISHILPSATGNLWFAEPKEGLWLFNLKDNQYYNLNLTGSSTEKLSIKSLHEDHDGKLWVGTLNYGLYGLTVKDNKIETLEHYTHNSKDKNSLSINMVTDVLRPQIIDTNALWISTTVGLNRLDLTTKGFTHYFKDDGLPNSFILKILEDDNGNIWVATAKGLGKFDVTTKKISSFSKDDGLPFPGFGGGKQNAAKAKDGQLFFSGGSGSIGFYPNQIKNNSTVPPIVLTDFKIYHESVNLDTSIQFIDKINLEYSQNTFSIEFVALNYNNSKKNQYAYKLEGFHKDWINSGTERVASFTNLDPGSYLFKVKGSNNLGVWNEKGTEVNIIIAPPWWRTWWFRILSMAILLFIVSMIYISKIYNLQKEKKRQAQFSRKLIESQENERKRIAGELHDSLGQNLMIINNLIQQYIIRTKEKPPELAQVEPEIKETIDEVRKISRNLHPHQLEQLGLSKAIESIAKKVSKISDIKSKIDIDYIDDDINPDLWIHVFRIVQEALTNVIKHSKANEVSLSIKNQFNVLVMKINDNGIGIHEVQQGITSDQLSGFGLESIKERTRLLNAELLVTSPLNGGTSILVKIPIEKKYD